MQLSLQSVSILSVSELIAIARGRLEQEFPEVWVEGEVSGLRAPASGHLYLTLKDAQAQLKAVVFRGVASRLRFGLDDGLSIVARGRLTIYEPRGDFQIVLDYLEPKGIGALQLAFEQLRERLAREGLFDESRKQPLPRFPRCVGLVTSLHGAALRDMLTVLRRRAPAVRVVIVPVLVQGDGAAQEIAEGITRLDEAKLVDVMIVGRGGGSPEDLWSFNEEAVVRAIAGCRTPVVSAVGHEIDYTLSDFAADVRAATPSAAAEAVVPVTDEVAQRLRQIRAHLGRALRSRLAVQQQSLGQARLVLQDVRLRFQRVAQQLDDLRQSGEAAMADALGAQRRALTDAVHRLRMSGPVERIRAQRALTPQLLARLRRSMTGLLNGKRAGSRHVLGMLGGLNPLAILRRGYAVLSRAGDRRTVKSIAETHRDEQLLAQLHDGRLLCRVQKLMPQE